MAFPSSRSALGSKSKFLVKNNLPLNKLRPILMRSNKDFDSNNNNNTPPVINSYYSK